jgi:hypothetical protein
MLKSVFFTPPPSPVKGKALLSTPLRKKEATPHSPFRITMEIVAKEVAETVSYALCGLAAYAIVPSIAVGLFTFSATLLVGRLLVVATNSYFPNSQKYKDFKQSIHRQASSYPKLKIITFIFSLATCIISRNVGCALAGILGAIHAVVVDVDRSKQNAPAQKEQEQHLPPASPLQFIK